MGPVFELVVIRVFAYLGVSRYAEDDRRGEGKAKVREEGPILVILFGFVISVFLDCCDKLVGRSHFAAAVWRIAGCHCNLNVHRTSLYESSYGVILSDGCPEDAIYAQ